MKLPFRSKRSKEIYDRRTNDAWVQYKRKRKGRKSRFSGKAH